MLILEHPGSTMKESARLRLLEAVSAYADEVGCALGSGPRQQPSALWRDLEACELLLRVLLPGPALPQPIDVECLQAGERRKALAENPDPRQRLESSEGTAERP